MAKITPQDIRDSGFFSEMFGQMDAVSFDTFINGAIDIQAAQLAARIGADLYATTDPESEQYVRLAERDLVIAEMWRRRITRKLGQAQGDTLSCKYETEARDSALTSAEGWIFRLTGGDIATGMVETAQIVAADA